MKFLTQIFQELLALMLQKVEQIQLQEYLEYCPSMHICIVHRCTCVYILKFLRNISEVPDLNVKKTRTNMTST